MHSFEDFALNALINLHPEDFSVYGLDNPRLEIIYQDSVHEAHVFFGDTFMQDVGGNEVEFIYLMFAGRPHVFSARYEPVQVLFGLNAFSFMERWIALINIQHIYGVDVTTTNPDSTYSFVINHDEDDLNTISPTINGIEIAESDFRTAYRLIIGMNLDAEIEEIYPRPTPAHVFTFRMKPEHGDDTVVSMYPYNPNFYAVSIDGGPISFVTNALEVNTFFRNLRTLI